MVDLDCNWPVEQFEDKSTCSASWHFGIGAGHVNNMDSDAFRLLMCAQIVSSKPVQMHTQGESTISGATSLVERERIAQSSSWTMRGQVVQVRRRLS